MIHLFAATAVQIQQMNAVESFSKYIGLGIVIYFIIRWSRKDAKKRNL